MTNKLYDADQTMLRDGNEIDATDGTLYLQNNTKQLVKAGDDTALNDIAIICCAF